MARSQLVRISLNPLRESTLSSCHIPSSSRTLVNASIAKSRSCAAVGGRDLHANSGLALRHDRIEEPDRVDAVRQQPLGHLSGQGGVADHDRRDRVLAGHDVELPLGHGRRKNLVFSSSRSRSSVERVQISIALSDAPRIGGATEFENRYGRDRWRSIVMISELRTRVAAAGTPQRLAQRAGDDVDPAHHVAIFVRSPAGLAHEADGVRIVDHHQGVVFVCQVAD